VIGVQELQDAEQRVSDRLARLREEVEAKSRPAADLEGPQLRLNELADELSRRAEEDERAADPPPVDAGLGDGGPYA